jgi:hypothetical protein
MAFTTAGLTNGGRTPHYALQYDDSLQMTAANPTGIEPSRTNAVVATCEDDFDLMSGWFGGIGLDVNLPILVEVTPNGGGAEWYLRNHNLQVRINSLNGPTIFVRYLLVMEMVEQFMRAQGLGWFGATTEGSEGEGLSRFLAAQFLAIQGFNHPPANFADSNNWLNSDREDFVNNIDPADDKQDAKTGCALLFIYYLFAQLGYSVNAIVAARAPTLGGVYKNLTGDSSDPFPAFKRLLDAHFPGRAIIPGPNFDNPFPLSASTSV